MKFALTIEVSVGVEDKTRLIVDLSNKLTEYFANRNYGNDVIRILIGMICVAPEFEWFSTIRKPRYKFYRKYKRDGIELIEDRDFTFDLKLDYESFKNQSDEENNKMLTSEILKSLSNLDKLPKKVKNFDKEKFKNDVEDFFKEQNLLWIKTSAFIRKKLR